MPKRVKLGSRFAGVAGFLNLKKAFDDAMRQQQWEKEKLMYAERGTESRFARQLASLEKRAAATEAGAERRALIGAGYLRPEPVTREQELFSRRQRVGEGEDAFDVLYAKPGVEYEDYAPYMANLQEAVPGKYELRAAPFKSRMVEGTDYLEVRPGKYLKVSKATQGKLDTALNTLLKQIKATPTRYKTGDQMPEDPEEYAKLVRRLWPNIAKRMGIKDFSANQVMGLVPYESAIQAATPRDLGALVEEARTEGYTDDEIIEFLENLGMSEAEINEAM